MLCCLYVLVWSMCPVRNECTNQLEWFSDSYLNILHVLCVVVLRFPSSWQLYGVTLSQMLNCKPKYWNIQLVLRMVVSKCKAWSNQNRQQYATHIVQISRVERNEFMQIACERLSDFSSEPRHSLIILLTHQKLWMYNTNAPSAWRDSVQGWPPRTSSPALW